MELTYFLAQLIGLYFLILGVLMLFRKDMFLRIVHEFYSSPVPVFLGGWIATLLGLLLVLNYNYWSSGILSLVITVIGWVALIKGVALLFAPGSMVGWVRSANLHKYAYFYAIVILVIGAYLTHAGFTQMGLLN